MSHFLINGIRQSRTLRFRQSPGRNIIARDRNRAAIYVRCSTLQQSLDIQITDLRHYAHARNLELTEIYQDHGVSGAKDSRLALNRMMADARRRRFDFVLVWRLDRLGRNTKHLLTIIEELSALNVSLISLQEAFDLSTSIGKVMVTIIAALSTFERDLIRERVVAGIEAAKRKGTKLGRPKTSPVEQIRLLRQKGLTYRQIIRELGVSMGAVQDALKCPLDAK